MEQKDNLRGERVRFEHDGRSLVGIVITRIRGTRWLIECASLPVAFKRHWSVGGMRRITLDRAEFTIEPLPPVRAGRSPIERMVDEACGITGVKS